jgi:hypothetical protein
MSFQDYPIPETHNDDEIEKLRDEIASSREQNVLLERRYNVLGAVVKHYENEIERLRAALEQIIELETLDDGELSTSGEMASQALAKEGK